MTFLSLAPFVPSGREFQKSRQLFEALGFQIEWDGGDYVGFARDGCKFILQNYDNRTFAENLMVNVSVSDIKEFFKAVNDNKLAEKYGIRVGAPTLQPYGEEVNIIDLAGVCWHFVQ